MKDVILFVHGFGSSHKCWEPLMELLRQDERITSRYDLVWWDYPTSWFSLNIRGRLPRLKELGESLGGHIDAKYRGRQLTVIGHSQGGLVIQSWMVDQLQGNAERLANIRQVIFIATPNHGSTKVRSLRRVLYSFFDNPQETTLRVLCPDVSDIQRRMTTDIVNATEDTGTSWRVPVHAFVGQQDDIVPEASAKGSYTSIESVPGNHFNVLRPSGVNDDRYEKLAGRLREPGGHSHLFENERYETCLRVEPRQPQIKKVQGGRASRSVKFDNFATLNRTVCFATANRCQDPFTIQYRTRKNGYIFPRISHENLAPLQDIGEWQDGGTKYVFNFKPSGPTEHWLNLEIYKGFDKGERDIHFHLKNHSFCRQLEYTLDLSAYVKGGYTVNDGPHFYFHPTDRTCDETCKSRNERELVQPALASPEQGWWQYRFENVRGGVVHIVWDVAPTQDVMPRRDLSPEVASLVPTIKLRSGESAVVGYGSLLSAQSLSRSLERRYDGPFVYCHVAGWRRSWDAAMPNEAFYFVEEGNERVYPQQILYLNVCRDPSIEMNCVIFVVSQRELSLIDEREWIYEKRDVTDQLRGVCIEGGRAILYVAREEHTYRGIADRRQAAVRQSYLRILEDGLAKTTLEFRREFERTSAPAPGKLVVEDVLDPKRTNPWAGAGFKYQPQIAELCNGDRL